MARLWDRFSRRESQPQSLTLAEVLAANDPVHVQTDPPAMVVTPKRLSDVETRELGNASPSPFTSTLRAEYSAELFGRNGLKKYDEMRRSDGTVRGTLRLIKSPVLNARWFIEPASESKADQNAADFVWWNLTKGMSIPFGQVIYEALLMLDFGFYMFEKVWEIGRYNNRDVMYWKKLAPRHPADVAEWHFDRAGGPAMVEMEPPFSQAMFGDNIKIPIEKLLVFTFDKEAGNIEGISLLRSAFPHWYYKTMLYKIDAIQKERHGIGIPIITLPPNFTPADKELAKAMTQNLRTNEMAHLVLPPNWVFQFAKLEGQPVDALKSAEHHDRQIQKNIVAPFLDKGGSAEEQQMMRNASRYIADIILEAFNKYAIPQLIGYNFERVGVPRLRATGIGSRVDQRTFSFAIRNLIGAGVIRPDDRLEDFVREEMELPPRDPTTAREIMTPQAARVGLPRQSTAPGQEQAQRPGGEGVGTDRSGG
jgi:hypothetical protein